MKKKTELIFDRYRHCKMFEDDKASNNFVELLERAVNNLPSLEQELIQKRYMVRNAHYILDRNIYQFKLDQPTSAPYYKKIRERAFVKINQMLNISNESVNLNDETINPPESIFKKYREFKFFNKTRNESKSYVELIEKIVNNLPGPEREIIIKRYMNKEGDYIEDRDIYQFKLDEPTHAFYYMKLRTRAFESIAIMLQLDPGVLHD